MKNTRTKCQSGTPFLDLGPLWFPYNIYLLHNKIKKKNYRKEYCLKKKLKESLKYIFHMENQKELNQILEVGYHVTGLQKEASKETLD